VREVSGAADGASRRHKEIAMFRRIAVVMVAVVSVASQAAAQDQWGVTAAVTPSWESGPGVKQLFSADRVDMQGSEVRIGFVRGLELSGDWGLSYVNTSIADNSSLDVDVSPCGRGNCGTFLRTVGRTRLTGFEFHQYQPFKTWRDRVQVGLEGAVGLGWLRGQVYKRTTTEQSDVESFSAPAGELFPPSRSVMPLARMEIAASAIVVRGVKVRASGGFAMPGYHRFGLTFVYLIPR
jgi:hypothetical protein